MGTRGAAGFRLEGRDYLTYNHFDSYPSALGADIVLAVKQWIEDDGTLLVDVKNKVRNIRLVDQSDTPTKKDVERLREYANLDVGKQSYEDWYCLLREAQGNLDTAMDTGVMINSHGFMNDSLFCEYAYIVNLDSMKLEFYVGFQEERHEKGRYAAGTGDEHDEYYGVALHSEYPLTDLPDMEALETSLCEEDE